MKRLIILLSILSISMPVHAILTSSASSESNAKSAFGALLTAELTPKVQCQFQYNINAATVEKRENNLGSITQSQGMALMQTGASANSAAHMLSSQPIVYRPGKGVVIRFTALFTAGVANSIQVAGVGEVGDGFFFGFNGADFSVLRREAGHKEIQTLSVSAGAGTGTGNITINLDGVSKTVAVTSGDSAREVAVKIADADFSDTGLGWSAGVDNTTVIFRAWSGGDKSGAFTLVDTDTTGSAGTFAETVAGVATTNNWIAQTAWNMDRFLFSTDPSNSGTRITLDPTKLNVYQIRYQWLGAGSIEFSIENPETGKFIVVHRIKYANSSTVPSIRNPSLPLHIMAKNNANTSNLTIKTASMGGFVEGRDEELGLNHGTSNVKIGVGTTETPIISLKNQLVYQGTENRARMKMLRLSVSSVGNKVATIKVLRSPTLLGTPAFANHEVNVSVASQETASTGVVGGEELLSIELSGTASSATILKDFILLNPGETIVVTGQVSSTTSDIGVAIQWREFL